MSSFPGVVTSAGPMPLHPRILHASHRDGSHSLPGQLALSESMSSTRSRILHRFSPSRIQVFRFRVYADLSRSPACFPLLRPLLTSHSISSSGSPQVRTRCFPAQPLHLPRRRNLWVSLCGASSPGRIGLLCSSCSPFIQADATSWRGLIQALCDTGQRRLGGRG